jgi:L-ascorbate metabolism protein UlaG (beta-lactamase superfamily)
LREAFDPLVVTPVGNGRLLRSIRIRVEELDWWARARTPRLPITLTPAQHFSARGPHDRNRALWGGFTMDIRGRRIYFAGDSGYGPMFGEIGRRIGTIDLALLPIGAYEPRWFMKDIHMNPDEAVRAHLDLNAKQSLGMHFGTFQLTTEAIDEPVRALQAARRDHGVPDEEFQTLDFGESIVI